MTRSVGAGRHGTPPQASQGGSGARPDREGQAGGVGSGQPLGPAARPSLGHGDANCVAQESLACHLAVHGERLAIAADGVLVEPAGTHGCGRGARRAASTGAADVVAVVVGLPCGEVHAATTPGTVCDTDEQRRLPTFGASTVRAGVEGILEGLELLFGEHRRADQHGCAVGVTDRLALVHPVPHQGRGAEDFAQTADCPAESVEVASVTSPTRRASLKLRVTVAWHQNARSFEFVGDSHQGQS